MKLRTIPKALMVLLVFGVLLSGCKAIPSAEIVQEVPPEAVVEQPPAAAEVAVTLAVIEDPPRFWKYPPLKPFGNELGVINQTGYVLKVFDLFNAELFSARKQQLNLLTSSIEDGARVVVKLEDHPELLAELNKKDGSKFLFNARDWDNDLYWGEWDPADDDWNLVVSSDQLEAEDEVDDEVPSFGPSLVIANNTGYPLEKLFLEKKRVNQMDGSETNVLENQLLQDGKRARIQVSDLPHLTEHLSFDAYSTITVSAYDTDGDLYSKYWHPTTDRWLIKLSGADLLWNDSNQYELLVENQTGSSLWYLYVADEGRYQAGEFSEDLLGMDIIDDGEQMDINLCDIDWLQELLDQQSETVMHVVAEDVDGTPYHATFLLSEGYPSVLFDAFIDETGEALTLYNDTPSDLWFLYLATDEMVKADDFGRDLLRDGIWEVKVEFTFKVSPALVENNQVLHLYAYDYLDNEYHKEWNVSDGWHLTFNADDLSVQ